jgi:hypothetical protein
MEGLSIELIRWGKKGDSQVQKKGWRTLKFTSSAWIKNTNKLVIKFSRNLLIAKSIDNITKKGVLATARWGKIEFHSSYRLTGENIKVMWEKDYSKVNRNIRVKVGKL